MASNDLAYWNKWEKFYEGRDKARYVAHLRTTYAPFFTLFFRVSQAATVTRERYVAMGLSPNFAGSLHHYELGAPPGYVLMALQQEKRAWMVGNAQGAPLAIRRLYFQGGYSSGYREDLRDFRDKEGNSWITPPPSIPADLTSSEYRQWLWGWFTKAGNVSPSRRILFSFGLLEHLDDESILRTLEICSKFSLYHLHYVPLVGHGAPSFGDERLLAREYWMALAKPSYWEVFNEGRDLVFLCGDLDMFYTRKGFGLMDYIPAGQQWEVS